uniref:Uncharacterized protein n=1 Tax=Scleropages formosus TaxID=113540 RepID=A0A8C9RBS7_SCLFO
KGPPVAFSIGMIAASFPSAVGSTASLPSKSPDFVMVILLVFTIIAGMTVSLKCNGYTVFPLQPLTHTVAETPGRNDAIDKARSPLFESDRTPTPGPLT